MSTKIELNELHTKKSLHKLKQALIFKFLQLILIKSLMKRLVLLNLPI